MSLLLDSVQFECEKSAIKTAENCDCFCCSWMTVFLLLLSVLIILLVICCHIYEVYAAKYKMQENMQKQQHEHEKIMKELSYKREDELFEKDSERKEKELNLRKREFDELTIRQKLLDKVIEKNMSEDIRDLKEQVEKLKSELDKAKVDISAYVFRKDDQN